MSGKTIAEKILSRHAHVNSCAGEIVICDVDFLMLHDAIGPLAIKAFEEMGGKRVFDQGKVVVILDHCTPAPNEKLSNIHAFLRSFVKEQKVFFAEGGEGVCHQVMIERGYTHPGDLILGTDSHTCTYGANGALATGVGATDIGMAMLTGKIWLKVPHTTKITFKGNLAPMCAAKDVILYTIGLLGADGCDYDSVEFYGDWLETAAFSDRLTMSNMVAEMGAKCGFTCCSSLGINADPDAEYKREITIDLSRIEPSVAKPHAVDNVRPVSDVAGVAIDQGVIGSCTNGRMEDLRAAAAILKGKRIKDGCRLLILPASNLVLKQAAEEGVLSTLIDAGATICASGCGVCVGTHGGVPADNEVVLATTNRNFKGRMGNNTAFIYLASPQTVAASMLTGKISDPRLL